MSRERYERILARLVQGDLFDSLWVSLRDDPQGGVVLSHEGDEIEMNVSFRSLKEPERIADFRGRMAAWGHEPAAEDEWSGGLGEDSQTVMLEYRFLADTDGLLTTVDQALGVLQGEEGENVFVHAWRSQDGPKGMGIKVRRERDVLAEVP